MKRAFVIVCSQRAASSGVYKARSDRKAPGSEENGMKSYRQQMWKKKMWKKKKKVKETQGGKQLPQLPEELIEEILKRLPVESLVRFSCTCKRWRSLIFSDSNFNKAHIHHAKRPVWKMAKIGCGERLVERAMDCDGNIATCPLLPTSVTRYICGDREVLGCCNGLMLFAGNAVSRRSRYGFFLLWNPYTNSIKRIPSFETGEFDSGKYVMSGLTYDSASDDYKVIVVLANRWGCTYVFSLRRMSWKKLSDSTIVDRAQKWRYYSFGVTLDNGSCYWEIQLDGQRLMSIICFDPVVEEFKEVPLPDNLRRDNIGAEGEPLGIGGLDGCLTIIRKNVVWVMKEYGCWTKLLHLIIAQDEQIQCKWLFQPSQFQPLGYNSNKDQALVLQVGTGNIAFLMFVDINKGVVRPKDDQFNMSQNTILYTETLLCPWLNHL